MTKKLTPNQRRVLENLAAGRRADAHCVGRSEFGGLTGTIAALNRMGLMNGYDITDAGRATLVSAPVADEPCKRCGGPGWYTSHTTGYPESIPCSACNPQGVSVERLAKDPFLAAQLWRKPAEADGSLLERILEHVGEYGESMASSTLLSVRSIARRNVETRIAAELAALASAPVAGETQQPVAWANEDGDPISDALKQARLDLYGKNYTRPLYTAPQASEAAGSDQPDIETLRRVGAAHDAVEVCPQCDIAGCRHIRHRAALSAQPPRTDRLPQRVMAQVVLHWMKENPDRIPSEDELVEAFELRWM